MASRLWTVGTLASAWLCALLAIGASQLLSFTLMPRAWEFFWLIPVDWSSPLALARVIASAWQGLWTQRPFEAFSLTVAVLLFAFSTVWLVARLWFASHHAIIANRAV